jgi:hypothetical protein
MLEVTPSQKDTDWPFQPCIISQKYGKIHYSPALVIKQKITDTLLAVQQVAT